jgi:sarcosine oxidase subunit gamma
MPEPVKRESPLARFGLDAGVGAPPPRAGIECREQAFRGHINLRGDPADPRLEAAVRSVLGVELPRVANTVGAASDATVYWLGPDEWLVVTPGERERAVANGLRAALGDMFSAVTELGGGQTILVLRGASVRDLLAKECPLDLDPRAFPRGTCAQSRLAKAPVLLRPLDDGAIEIVVRRSFADYLWLWLQDAAAEYGLHAGSDAAAQDGTDVSGLTKPAGQPALS